MSQDASRRLAEEYSASAREYARLWGPLILPLSLPLLERLPLGDADRVLDVGTGVGGLREHLRQRAQRSRICGVDRALGMLRQATRTGNDALAAMDAGALAFRSGTFDVVTLAFVLFHLREPLAGLRETARVLRPGGSLGLTTWAHDPGLPGNDLWGEELDRCGAGPDPRDDAVRRHDLVDEPEKVRRLLGEAGLEPVEIWTLPQERPWDSRSLLPVQQSCGVAGRRLATLPTAEREACVERVRRRLEALPPEQLVWRTEVLLAVASS